MPYLNRIWYILMVYSAVFTWLQENEHMLFWFVVKALLWEYNLYGKTFTIESDLKRNLKSSLGSQYILNNMLMKGFGVSTLSLQTVLAICVHNLKHFTFLSWQDSPVLKHLDIVSYQFQLMDLSSAI